MSIIGVKFVCLVAAAFLAYFILPKKCQWVVILFANLIFYYFAGVKYFAYIIISSGAAFILSLKIDKITEAGAVLLKTAGGKDEKKKIRKETTRKKKTVCAAAVVISIGIWAVVKFGGFFVTNINALIKSTVGSGQLSAFSLVLPLGMSFYTFHIVGYVVDIYRKKYPAERNYLKFFTFVTYFPHMTEGPFSRYDELSKTLFEKHDFSYDRLCQGLSRILWGFTKKLVIADTIGFSVTEVITNYWKYSGVHVLLALFGYSIQMYADFSGYMDIVCGVSHIFGNELAENFRQPYFSKSVNEFWRRWHITLGTWFKDYIFMPVSMSSFGQKLGKSARKKFGARMGRLVPGYFALIFVWGATGLWHGADWEYIVWGYLNMFFIVLSMQLSGVYDKIKSALHIKSEGRFWQAFMVVRTFVLVSFIRIFSSGFTLSVDFEAVKHVFTHFNPGEFLNSIGGSITNSAASSLVIIIGTILLIIIDILNETGRWQTVKVKCPLFVRAAVYASLIIALLLLSSNQDLTDGFMYAVY